MLTVTEAIKQRRSIRRFKPDPVPDEYLREMLEAARLAPSGSNRQPWRFIVTTDAEEKKILRRVSLDQAFIEEAPAVFVCCADLTAYSRASRLRREQEVRESGLIRVPVRQLRRPQVPRDDRSTVPDSRVCRPTWAPLPPMPISPSSTWF